MADAVTLVALPATVNLDLWRGDSFAFDIEVWGQPEPGDPPTPVPYDLTGAVPHAQIRVSPTTPLLGEFVITVDGNILTLLLLPEVSASLPRRSRWDVDLTEGDRVITLAAGTITLDGQITRPK